ncbi:serine/threonine protein kinase [Weizmannia acidilactici]|uniref:Serine/threonine protein kinase n=1 Tax=Weizmannia acidilactici TaxID=2607726 RepID=A0A5J4JIW0_9BACI|nr:serine/threonine protein kinase [Weizmannia acidilactici]GER71209.1 serine/threonine protein kinase [Weizmannia acidilactici]GER74852.1 serine/threonine protein kinase [Weizmannia acidilactici]
MNEQFRKMVEEELLKHIMLESKNPHDPIIAKYVPDGWSCIGTGNYAAVFSHPSQPDWVVKVMRKNAGLLEKEAEVYNRLGDHPAYSKCIYQGKNYLVLKKLKGITLYDAIAKGIRIPESVIKDINEALEYAKQKGLNPYDVHAKNVMMKDGKGYVVDVSDFYKKGKDDKWDDFVKAYYKIYLKTLYKFQLKIPYKVLDLIRHSYRLYKNIKRSVPIEEKFKIYHGSS